jgi:hypothetical protein
MPRSRQRAIDVELEREVPSESARLSPSEQIPNKQTARRAKNSTGAITRLSVTAFG